MVSCTFAQVRNILVLFYFKQTLERTTKQQLRNHKPSLGRSLRDCLLASNNKRQLRPSKVNSLILEGDGEAITFLSRRISVSCTVCPYVLCFSCVFCFFLVWKFPKQVREARRILNQGWERLEYANQMDEAGHRHLDLRERKTILYHVSPCPPHDKNCCFSMLIAFL